MSKADKRKGFVLYFDQIEQVGMLNDEEAGQLFKALFSCNSDKNPPPCFKNPLIQMCFSVIHAQMKRDAEKYEQKCERMAENARKKWEEQVSEEGEEQLDAIACNTKTKKEKNKKINIAIDTDGVKERESETEKTPTPSDEPFFLTQAASADAMQEDEELERLLQKGVPPTYIAVRIDRAREYANEKKKFLSDVILAWWMKDKQTPTWQRESRRLDDLQRSALSKAAQRESDAETDAWIARSDRYFENLLAKKG